MPDKILIYFILIFIFFTSAISAQTRAVAAFAAAPDLKSVGTLTRLHQTMTPLFDANTDEK